MTEQVTALAGFRFVGTMNPGGDYGKKELSPALRNRFTEIWVPGEAGRADLLSIVTRNLKLPDKEETRQTAEALVSLVCWLRKEAALPVSVRDCLACTAFIQAVVPGLRPGPAVWEAAHLVWLDGLAGPGADRLLASARAELARLVGPGAEQAGGLQVREDGIQCGPFNLARLAPPGSRPQFSFQAETISENVRKVARALQIPKPILLEGEK